MRNVEFDAQIVTYKRMNLVTGGQYLVRGQLIDHEDFFYKPQQDTAHYYANIMPIWTSVDDGNWELTGSIVRKVAGDTKTNLELWSGGMGTLELEDAKGNKVH